MKKIITLFVLTLIVTSGFAQVKLNDELKQLINTAFAFFPKVKEVENTLLTAQEKLNLTKLSNTISINGIGSYTFIDPTPKVFFPVNGVDKAFEFQPKHNINTAVMGNYVVVDFGRLKASIERSKDELQFANHNLENTQLQLANQVAIVYYNICFYKKAISIQDSILTFLTENKKIISSKIKDGDGLKIDLLNIQANIDNEENKKIDLLNTLQKQQYLLKYTTGVNEIKGMRFDFDLPILVIDEYIKKATQNNVDLLLIKDKIKQTEHDIAITNLQDKPLINLNAGAGFRNGIQPNITDFRFNYLAGVSLVFPIYTGGKTKQQVKLQQTFIKQNEIAITPLQSNFQKEIEQSYSDIATLSSRIGNTKGQIDQAIYAQQLASIRYKNGVGTNLELINAGTNLQRAELTRLQYQYQLCLAKVDLAKIMAIKYW